MSNPALPKLNSRSWGEWFRQVRVPAVLLSCIAIFFLGLLYYQATSVSGIEINVRDWSIRKFTLRRDPFSGIQIGGIRYSSDVNRGLAWSEAPELLKCNLDAAIKKHLVLQNMQKDRWDLVLLDPGSREGDAKVLFDLLNAYDNSYDCFWIEWSTNQKKDAAVLWPAAQDLVNLEFYSLLPGLFQLALQGGDDYDLGSAIQAYMQDQIAEQCKLLEALGQASDCSRAAEVGLSYGESAQLQQYVD